MTIGNLGIRGVIIRMLYRKGIMSTESLFSEKYVYTKSFE